MTQEALKLALEGVEIHSPNSPEYIVCAALIEALAQTQEPVAQPASEEDMKIYKTIAANYHKDLSTPPQRTEQDGQCKRCTDGCPACDATKLQKESHDLL